MFTGFTYATIDSVCLALNPEHRNTPDRALLIAIS
jgi:hypothetical protein